MNGIIPLVPTTPPDLRNPAAWEHNAAGFQWYAKRDGYIATISDDGAGGYWWGVEDADDKEVAGSGPSDEQIETLEDARQAVYEWFQNGGQVPRTNTTYYAQFGHGQLATSWMWQVGDFWVAVMGDAERETWWEDSAVPGEVGAPTRWELPIDELPSFGTLRWLDVDGNEQTADRGPRRKEEPMKVARYTVIVEREVGEQDGAEYHHGIGRKAVEQLAKELQTAFDNGDADGRFNVIKRELVDYEDTKAQDDALFPPSHGKDYADDADGFLADLAALVVSTQEDE